MDKGKQVNAPAEMVAALSAWFVQNRRSLPWRENADPYRVWVSEIMLQQTRIEAVLPYYERFMTALPTVAALADADRDTLFKLWEGLGYYSRVLNLQKAARMVVDTCNGRMPETYEELLKLPGIGPYTAGAVASICFDEPVPAVDGNVLRVMARVTDCRDNVLEPPVKKQLTEAVERLLPPTGAGRFNQALMELGETRCLPNGTLGCDACPIRAFCQGYAAGTAATLPVREKKTVRRIERLRIIVICTAETPARVLIRRRPETGLLGGMWELPHILPEEDVSLFVTGLWAPLLDSQELPNGRHLFSHIEWQLCGCAVTVDSFMPPDDYRLVDLRSLAASFALPSAFRTYTRLLPILLKEREP